jgi:hypothetical protein
MSEIKVNKISPRTACGTTTLGDSGDTFNLPSGGTLTIASGATINNNGTANNFGATGAVNWQTTVKTSGFTATSGEGYFINTTGGAVSVNLPAGTAGAVVGFKDYAGTFDTNNVTLVQNGSDKIGGSTTNATLNIEGSAITLVFIDSTQGWLVTDSGLQTDAPQPSFVTATGGTITTSGDFKIHTFTGPGTFCVSNAGNDAGSNTVDYLVVAGGGSGGNSEQEGGGGGGGFRTSSGAASGSYAVSCLGTPVSALPVTATGFPITVGSGGAVEGRGSNSIFSSVTSTGGGSGAPGPLGPGGSGGGSGDNNPAGSGNTPPVSPAQGKDGGIGNQPDANDRGGGGGGAGVVGFPGVSNGPGKGGGGSYSDINPAAGVADGPLTGKRYFAGGGGGGAWDLGRAGGGFGGGGAGAKAAPGPASVPSEAGVANTGGGGGGAACSGKGASAGGSGIVIIRYKFQ